MTKSLYYNKEFEYKYLTTFSLHVMNLNVFQLFYINSSLNNPVKSDRVHRLILGLRAKIWKIVVIDNDKRFRGMLI